MKEPETLFKSLEPAMPKIWPIPGLSVSWAKKNLLLGINNKVLLYSIGNYIECPMVNHNGKEYENIYIYI